jgi:hypothetical protein
MAGPRIDLEAELDRLFALRPSDFVAARNALAARLSASGDKSAAQRVRALKKPSLPAWAVNQLRYETPRVLAALLASGDRLRSRPSDIPAALKARSAALAEARKKAAELLAAGGHSSTPQTMQRVSSTLEALATYGNAPGRASAGRLTEELEPPGFDEVASLGILRGVAGAPKARAPRPPVPSSPVGPVSAGAERASARERTARAKALSARRREAEKLRGKLAAAEKKAEVARRARQRLETALANASREEREHQEAADAARKAVQAADAALRDAGQEDRR